MSDINPLLDEDGEAFGLSFPEDYEGVVDVTLGRDLVDKSLMRLTIQGVAAGEKIEMSVTHDNLPRLLELGVAVYVTKVHRAWQARFKANN